MESDALVEEKAVHPSSQRIVRELIDKVDTPRRGLS
jgi:hypothetical protein